MPHHCRLLHAFVASRLFFEKAPDSLLVDVSRGTTEQRLAARTRLALAAKALERIHRHQLALDRKLASRKRRHVPIGKLESACGRGAERSARALEQPRLTL